MVKLTREELKNVIGGVDGTADCAPGYSVTCRGSSCSATDGSGCSCTSTDSNGNQHTDEKLCWLA